MTTRRLRKAITVADVRRLARRSLPRAVFDFVDGGAEDEGTVRENERALARARLRPRVLVDTSAVDTSTTLFGASLELPLLLAPTGLAGLAAPAGELAAARAAAANGVGFVCSSASSVRMEDIARETGGGGWFQLYPWGDRGVTSALIDRAAASGYKALCVTVDVPVVGSRDRDRRNGFTIPPRFSASTLIDFVRHPAWSLRMLRDPPQFANLVDLDIVPDSDVYSIAAFVNEKLVNPATDWRELEWIRSQWRGPLVIKGIMTPEDGHLAVAAGADGIVVSNHGGRQLDGVQGTMHVLPSIVDAVGADLKVLMDGGVRRGADVLRAVAAGADACLIGRPFWYGLAVAGEAGVDHVLSILREELRRTLQLLGSPCLADLDRTFLSLSEPRPC